MIKYGSFTSHSGLTLPWKIDCDSFTQDDWNAIARIVSHKFAFSEVVGVPRGGLLLEKALKPYRTLGYPTLIVDDVFTTGKSMEEYRKTIDGPCTGVVVFARGPVPDWIYPAFTVNVWAQTV